MKYLILFLSIIIVGCKSSVEPELPERVQYPIQIVAWEIPAPDNADWIGSSFAAKSAGDTVIVSDTTNHSVRIFTDINDGGWNQPLETPYFFLVFEDFTINQAWFDSTGAHVSTRINDDFNGLSSVSPIVELTDSSLINGFQFSYSCEPENLDGLNIFEYSYWDKNADTLITQYDFTVDGFVETLQFVVCGDSASHI